MSELEPARRHRVAPAWSGAILALAMLLGACSDGGEPTIVALSPPPTTSIAVTTTAATTTTTSTTTTTTSTTTTIPVTTTSTLPRQLTDPIAPPPDQRGPEDNPPIGRIAIPAIGLDSELEEGIRLTTLDRGPGHWPGSAMPGELGNVVIGGHRTSRAAEFRELDQLVPGDEVVFSTETGEHTYSVTGTEIVGPDALWITDRTDTPTATLFACHPLGSTSQRIVVYLALAA